MSEMRTPATVEVPYSDIEDAITALCCVIVDYGHHAEQTAHFRNVVRNLRESLLVAKGKQNCLVKEWCGQTGAYASFCEGCEIWTVHCPECQTNFCGGGCKCGYEIVQQKWQDQLNVLVNQ